MLLAIVHTEPSFTSSLLLVCMLSAAGLTSLQLGAWMWLGYTVVEVVAHGQQLSSYRPSALGLAGATVAHAVLLGMLLIGVPMMVVATRVEIRSFRWLRRAGPLAEATAAVLAAGVMLCLFAQATVLLVRPVFTLQSSLPTVAAVAPVQTRWWVVVAVGMVAVVLRLYTERRALSPRVEAAIAAATARFTVAGVWRPPSIVGATLSAAVMTLLLASVVSGWIQAGFTFAVLIALTLLRNRIRASGSLSALGAIPTLARLIIALFACVAITRVALGFVVSPYGTWSTNSFVVPWLSVLVSACVVVLLTAPAPKRGSSVKPTRA